jgi:MerR family transcriptional regulator, copper efflux regulator
MEGLTIHEAAETTGWSPRMLRYIEAAGLVEPARTPSGYRVFGPGELQRLRTLRELLARFECTLSDVAFAKRVTSGGDLRAALERWFEAEPELPEGVTSDDWLSWEQEKHERLLAAAAAGEERSRIADPASTGASELTTTPKETTPA